MRTAASLLIFALAFPGTPATAKTYANPIDVDYRYNFEQTNERISYRTGADPVIVRFKDAYYLFLTLADGYWRSDDLVDWTFVTPSRWPMQSVVAPAVTSEGKCAPRSTWAATTPKAAAAATPWTSG